MADRTGVSLGYLSQIELGKNSASIETLYRICLALGMKMSELFQAVQGKMRTNRMAQRRQKAGLVAEGFNPR